jgi:hypothetical protein
VKSAGQQLAVAWALAGGADVKAYEADATDLKAQIEARRRQLADAAAHAAPVPDSPAVTQQRARLEAAQQAETAAFSDWTNSKTELAQAQSVLDRLQSTQPDLVRENNEFAALTARHDALKQDLERDAAIVPVIPVDPDHEDGVQIISSNDKRPLAEGGIGAFFAIGALGLLIRAGRKGNAADKPNTSSHGDDASAALGQPMTAA